MAGPNFSHYLRLAKIEIPASVEGIMKCDHKNCFSLFSVHFPSGSASKNFFSPSHPSKLWICPESSLELAQRGTEVILAFHSLVTNWTDRRSPHFCSFFRFEIPPKRHCFLIPLCQVRGQPARESFVKPMRDCKLPNVV
jgi:hypothetical protein